MSGRFYHPTIMTVSSLGLKIWGSSGPYAAVESAPWIVEIEFLAIGRQNFDQRKQCSVSYYMRPEGHGSGALPGGEELALPGDEIA